jgi:hypothetical protein
MMSVEKNTNNEVRFIGRLLMSHNKNINLIKKIPI